MVHHYAVILNCHWQHYQNLTGRNQALSLWSGSTDSKTLDYQRINSREYQIELTQWKPLEYKTCHYPTTSSSLCRMPHLNNKQNKNTNPIISRQDYHLTQPCPSEEKQINRQQQKTQYKFHPIWSFHKPLDQPYECRNQKKERIQPWSLGKEDLKHNKSFLKNEKAEKYYTNEGTN